MILKIRIKRLNHFNLFRERVFHKNRVRNRHLRVHLLYKNATCFGIRDGVEDPGTHFEIGADLSPAAFWILRMMC